MARSPYITVASYTFLQTTSSRVSYKIYFLKRNIQPCQASKFVGPTEGLVCSEAALESVSSVPGTAEATLASSSFSQRGLQSRSPEAMCKVSDPESLDVTVLSEDEVCSDDGCVRHSLSSDGLSEYKWPAPFSSVLWFSFILVQSRSCGPKTEPSVGSGH